jgi:hypothetical protein
LFKEASGSVIIKVKSGKAFAEVSPPLAGTLESLKNQQLLSGPPKGGHSDKGKNARFFRKML